MYMVLLLRSAATGAVFLPISQIGQTRASICHWRRMESIRKRRRTARRTGTKGVAPGKEFSVLSRIRRRHPERSLPRRDKERGPPPFINPFALFGASYLAPPAERDRPAPRLVVRLP